MLKPTRYIWIAEDHDTGELIFATPHFDDLIDYLCDNYIITEDLEVNNNLLRSQWKPLRETFGENWREVLKKFSSVRINQLFDWEISLRQIELLERVED